MYVCECVCGGSTRQFGLKEKSRTGGGGFERRNERDRGNRGGIMFSGSKKTDLRSVQGHRKTDQKR